jgi:hypothetical protein
MKPQVIVQLTMDATVLEENYHRTPTALGHQLVDLLRAATAPVALVVVAARRLMVMLAAEAAAAGAPHTGLEGEPVAEAIAEAEATQTATSLVFHATATMPAAELKKFDGGGWTAAPLGRLEPPCPSHLLPLDQQGRTKESPVTTQNSIVSTHNTSRQVLDYSTRGTYLLRRSLGDFQLLGDTFACHIARPSSAAQGD